MISFIHHSYSYSVWVNGVSVVHTYFDIRLHVIFKRDFEATSSTSASCQSLFIAHGSLFCVHDFQICLFHASRYLLVYISTKLFYCLTSFEAYALSCHIHILNTFEEVEYEKVEEYENNGNEIAEKNWIIVDDM